jgi:hypothetical protein
MQHARYRVVDETEKQLVIRDLGHLDNHPTVTNDAANVVKELAARLMDRRLLYFDSDGSLSELLVREGRFVGFAPYND